MRRCGIQDRINPYQDPIKVGTAPEEPVGVKEMSDYQRIARRICSSHRYVAELRGILVQCEETSSKLADYQKWLIDPHSRYTSEAFLHTLLDLSLIHI